MRGTFANVKLQNKLAEGKRGGYTRDPQTGAVDAAPQAKVSLGAALSACQSAPVPDCWHRCRSWASTPAASAA